MQCFLMSGPVVLGLESVSAEGALEDALLVIGRFPCRCWDFDQASVRNRKQRDLLLIQYLPGAALFLLLRSLFPARLELNDPKEP